MKKMWRAFVRWLNAEDVKKDPIDQFEEAALADPGNAKIKRALKQTSLAIYVFLLLGVVWVFLPVPLLYIYLGWGTLGLIRGVLRFRLYSPDFSTTRKAILHKLLGDLPLLIVYLYLFRKSIVSGPIPFAWKYVLSHFGDFLTRSLAPVFITAIAEQLTLDLCLLYRQFTENLKDVAS